MVANLVRRASETMLAFVCEFAVLMFVIFPISLAISSLIFAGNYLAMNATQWWIALVLILIFNVLVWYLRGKQQLDEQKFFQSSFSTKALLIIGSLFALLILALAIMSTLML